MKLTRNKIFTGILIFGLITNILVYFNIQYFYLGAIFSFIFLTTIPGLLIMLMFRIRKVGFWEYLAYTIGLSIAFLMFAGLAVNWTLPWLHITNKPLSLYPLLISFDILLLIFGFIAYKRNKKISLKISFPKLNLLNKIFFITPVIFPILSILGAISLNNHGSNFFTMIMLGSVPTYVFFMFIFREKLNSNIFPYSIFFISTSLLFMTSLRGWYVTGHDIQQEYYVFQLTKSNYHWSISLFQDAYNACLSLNILPTIFSSFLNINDIYIYKVIFQIIFSFAPISIYLLFRSYSQTLIAYLSVFYFMSFPTFLNDMPMLNRQEIALLFFALMLLALFNKTIKPGLKGILFLIFGFSLVVSHYSTNYVTVAIFILTFVVSFVIKRNFIKEKIHLGNKNYYLTWVMVLGIVIFTFLWNIQLNQTSGGLTRLVSQTWQNINKSFSQDLKSGDVLYSIFSWQKLDKDKLLDEYVLASVKEVEISEDRDFYYGKSVYEKYKISVLDDYILPLTPLGEKLKNISLDTFSLNYYLRQSSAKVVQVLLIIGFIVIILKRSPYIKKIDTEYNVLALVSIFLLGFLIILPMFSIEYGTLRFFQQALIILALPTIVGCLMIFNFLGEKTRLYMSLATFIVFFLSLSGFIPQILGGYYPQLQLNNSGALYDSYYTHKSEVDSIKWLSIYYNNEYSIQSNLEASSKMLASSNLDSLNKMIPVSIRKDSYVYLDYSNVKYNRNTIYYKGDVVTYDYPIEFLNENKNLIYNNGGSEIFK